MIITRYSPTQFNFDFTPFLTASDGTLNDSITTVTWTIPSEISSSSQTNTTTVATIFIETVTSTSHLNSQYFLSVNIVTANSQNLTYTAAVAVAAVTNFPGTLLK
jgi:hypothetical protein